MTVALVPAPGPLTDIRIITWTETVVRQSKRRFEIGGRDGRRLRLLSRRGGGHERHARCSQISVKLTFSPEYKSGYENSVFRHETPMSVNLFTTVRYTVINYVVMMMNSADILT